MHDRACLWTAKGEQEEIRLGDARGDGVVLNDLERSGTFETFSRSVKSRAAPRQRFV